MIYGTTDMGTQDGADRVVVVRYCQYVGAATRVGPYALATNVTVEFS